MKHLIEFLKNPDIQEALERQDLEYCYSMMSLGRRSVLTQFLISNNVNPLDYVNSVVGAMYYNLNIESIEIPDEILSIGTNAFERCTKLTSVKLPRDLYTIQSCGFYGCENLKEIVIPKGTNNINQNAFTMCLKLKKIVIPETVNTIHPNAFDHCDKLKIYCVEDSYAHKYAIDNEIPYELI